ncbi:glutathione S-transferase D7 isoform X1 [Anastrepha ludens]|uniref:glutathione S-transferase D7 isoform X1 n=2 Tax=Anastrepha ludens TaxID=28586 RepID=UPI0023AEB9B2|nr:glutathione S-transferase D7 isoform X1 [Anastrepha ludens]
MFDETAHIVKEFVYCILSRGGSKMVPTLYYLPPSPPCRSILLLGKILGVDFDLKTVNVLEGEQLSPDFTSINPQHCIPTLNDEGLVLWESRAILQYLAAAYGKDDSLYPKDVRTRAMVDQRLQFDLSTLYARTFDYFFPTIFHGSPLNASKKAKLCEAFNWFNEMLRDHEFSATDNFTIADITLSVTVSQCEAFGFDISAYDYVMVWLQRCKDYLLPYEYEELNATKAVILADMFRAKLGSQKLV